MVQLYTQQDRQPDTWVMSGAPAATTLYLSLETTVNYSDGAHDTLPATTLAVLPDATTTFDRTSNVFVAYTVKGSGVLSVIKESMLPTLTSDYAPLARVELHGIKPYQPEPYLASGGVGTLVTGLGGAGTTPADWVPLVASSTAAKALAIGVDGAGGAPSGWMTPGFVDAGWGGAVHSGTGGSGQTIAGTDNVWSEVPLAATREQALIRQTFPVPAGTVSALRLQLKADDQMLEVWLNGHAVPGVDSFTTYTNATQTLSVDPALAVPGATNLIAVRGSDLLGGGAWVDYLLQAQGSSTPTVATTTGPGGTVPATQLPLATTSSLGVVQIGSGLSVTMAGVLSAGGGGTVTSVALSAPGTFTVSGSPVTGSGTLALAWASAAANTLLAGPSSGGSATPTFRALVAADLGLTSRGDLLTRDASALRRLAVGAVAGHALLSDATDPYWGDVAAHGPTRHEPVSHTDGTILVTAAGEPVMALASNAT